MNDGGTGLAVFRPVGTGKKGLSADSAPFMFFPIKQSCCQRFIQRQDSGTEPVAQQGVGNALHTNTFFSIVKGKAVPALIVVALMDQLSSSAVLGIGHDGDFLFDIYHLLSDGQKNIPLIFISFLPDFFGVFIGKLKKYPSISRDIFKGIFIGVFAKKYHHGRFKP